MQKGDVRYWQRRCWELKGPFWSTKNRFLISSVALSGCLWDMQRHALSSSAVVCRLLLTMTVPLARGYVQTWTWIAAGPHV